MSLEIVTLLAGLAIKYGPDVALAFGKMFKGGATIDDAIAALELAKTKTAEQYLAEARAAISAESFASATPVPTV